MGICFSSYYFGLIFINPQSTSVFYHAATNCTHGSVRLSGGLTPTEGRVEVCVNGIWSAVCHYDWNYQDAFVVCRQLGYPASGVSLKQIFLLKQQFDCSKV